MNLSNFQMPEKIEVDDATFSNTFGRFIVQPLEKGYGVTLGNMMRRVLLSSLEGAAITAIKVNDVQHEFSTIEGVYEDLPEIVLNLKQLRVKLLDNAPTKIVLHLKGPMELTGKTIQENSTNLEILNPDLHIATLNENAVLNMELYLGTGRGYNVAEENKNEDMPLGVIPIDSIFSPIMNVKYTVENTRVGQRTDFEKLILDITTDGSVTPDDALTQAAQIIKEHLQIFVNFDIESQEEEKQEIDEETLRIRKLLKMSVDELELSVRSHNCLKAANIKTIADLVSRDEQEMLKFKNFGRKSLNELSKILEERGLQFGMDIEKYLKPEESKK
ncbi:MAG TPA: DNA-directed RNA polymerase subunit alpha [Caldithrix abyssi]|uniref:DNA-directed RNA polymerase subunit alpha n=1 Tax=Caldithrix abyssi TaxID=187145 RepID=A0A7V5H4U3_CALAY|nr:DNA-directed RNA polymerase subunit alpha [Caldithrix abyssi]